MGAPYGHVHDEACGYAEASEGTLCAYQCGLCVTGWQWEDAASLLAQDGEGDTWGLGVPGAREETPLARADLEALLPQAVTVETAAGTQRVELIWNLETFPESAWKGSYSLTAALAEDYVLTESAPRLEVLADLGGGETYELTDWAFNNWTWEGYNLQGDAVVGICIDGVNSPAELKGLLEKRLPQRIAVTIWGNKDVDGTSHFTTKENSTKEGWLTVFWTDLNSQLSQISDWRNDFTLYAMPLYDNKFNYIVNDNSGKRISQIPITLFPLSLEGHTVSAANPLATTVNLFDYYIETDGAKGNDLLIGRDCHWDKGKQDNVNHSSVRSWDQGINAGRLLLFSDGNIHAGMEGIVKPVLEHGYPMIDADAMEGQIADYKFITDWELCGDELDGGPAPLTMARRMTAKSPSRTSAKR